MPLEPSTSARPAAAVSDGRDAPATDPSTTGELADALKDATPQAIARDDAGKPVERWDPGAVRRLGADVGLTDSDPLHGAQERLAAADARRETPDESAKAAFQVAKRVLGTLVARTIAAREERRPKVEVNEARPLLERQTFVRSADAVTPMPTLPEDRVAAPQRTDLKPFADAKNQGDSADHPPSRLASIPEDAVLDVPDPEPFVADEATAAAVSPAPDVSTQADAVDGAEDVAMADSDAAPAETAEARTAAVERVEPASKDAESAVTTEPSVDASTTDAPTPVVAARGSLARPEPSWWDRVARWTRQVFARSASSVSTESSASASQRGSQAPATPRPVEDEKHPNAVTGSDEERHRNHVREIRARMANRPSLRNRALRQLDQARSLQAPDALPTDGAARDVSGGRSSAPFNAAAQRWRLTRMRLAEVLKLAADGDAMAAERAREGLGDRVRDAARDLAATGRHPDGTHAVTAPKPASPGAADAQERPQTLWSRSVSNVGRWFGRSRRGATTNRGGEAPTPPSDATSTAAPKSSNWWSRLRGAGLAVLAGTAAAATLAITAHTATRPGAEDRRYLDDGAVPNGRGTTSNHRWWHVWFGAGAVGAVGSGTAAMLSARHQKGLAKVTSGTQVAEAAATGVWKGSAFVATEMARYGASGADVHRADLVAAGGSVAGVAFGSIAGGLGLVEAFRDPKTTRIEKARAAAGLGTGLGWGAARIPADIALWSGNPGSRAASLASNHAMLGVGAFDVVGGAIDLVMSGRDLVQGVRTGDARLGAYAGLNMTLAAANGTRSMARGLAAVGTGISPIIETAALQVGGGALAIRGAWGLRTQIKAARDVQARREAVRSRLARSEARAAIADFVGDTATARDARRDARVGSYLFDVFGREKSDHTFRAVTSGVDVATGAAMLATPVVGVAAAFGLAAGGFALRGAKLATDYAVQESRNRQARRRDDTLARMVLEKWTKGRIAMRAEDHDRLTEIRRLRLLRQAYRRGATLQASDRWSLRLAANVDASDRNTADRQKLVVDYILERSDADREWVLDLLGLSEEDLIDLRAEARKADDPEAALREQLAGCIGFA